MFYHTLPLPEAITTIKTALYTISKLAKFFSENGVHVTRPVNLFLTMDRILPLTWEETAPVLIEMHLQKTSDNNQLENTPITFPSGVWEIWMALAKKHATQ